LVFLVFCNKERFKRVKEILPQRVVVLSPEVQEILFELGVGEKIVGNTKYCDYPEYAKNITKVGDFKNPNIEKILSLKPDIIFVTDFVQKDTINTLKKLNLKYCVIYSRNINEMFENILYIGEISGKQKQAKAIIKRLKKELEHIKRIIPKPKVFPLLWDNPIYTAGDETIVNDMIERSGAINLAKFYGKNYFSIDEEFLISSDIDFIILCDKSINTNSTLIKLIKKNKPDIEIISQINPDLMLRASSRIIEGIKELNKILYERTASKK